MKRLCLALLLGVGMFAQMFAQRPMDFDDVMKIKSAAAPQISPDGRWVAYTISAADMKEDAVNTNIWLVASEGGSPRQLTRHPKTDTSPRWSPDGKWIAFLSDRGDGTQIYRIAPDGGEAENLTTSKSPVSAFQWSPDGKSIAYLSVDPSTEAQTQHDKDKDDARVNEHEYRMTHLWVMTVVTRAAHRLTHGWYTVSDPQWSPDSRWIAYVTNPTPHANDGGVSDIWIVAPDGAGGPRKIAGAAGPEFAPRWSPDGKRVAFTGHPETTDTVRYNKLHLLDPFAENAKPVALGRAAEFDPGPATWSADGKWLYFNPTHRTLAELYAVAADDSAVKRVSDGKGTISQFSLSKDGTKMAFVWGDTDHPNDVYISALDTFRPLKLTDANPQVKDFALGKTEVVHWKSRDGMEIEGLLLYPAGYTAGRKYPLLVHVHGGPSGVVVQSFMASSNNFGQVWAGKGWVMLYPNFRGSSSYGEAFQRSNINAWGKGDFTDIQSGVDLLVERGIADPDRLAQTGWSYGGYMTAWTITQTNRFKAAMVGAGLTNMISMYSTNDLQNVLNSYFGGPPWGTAQMEKYLQASAMNYITHAKTPTLILHGAADNRVPPTQGIELYEGLKQNHVPVEMVTFPREPHGFGEPRHQLDRMKREYTWIAKYTLGARLPAAAAEAVKVAPVNFTEVAATIVRSLDVHKGERVMMHLDPTYYPELVDELRKELYKKGAVQVGAMLANSPAYLKEHAAESPEYVAAQADAFKKMLADTDIFLWLPMRGDRGVPIEKLMSESNWKGRAIHFHWVAPDLLAKGPETTAWLAAMYEEALKVDPKVLGATQDRLIASLRHGQAHLTAPDGTDLRFEVRDRPFHKNDGVATRERAAIGNATGSLRDREFELPAGALRVIPVEDSWEGTLAYYGSKLSMSHGRITEASARGNPQFWAGYSSLTGDRDRLGELVIGTNPKLVPVDKDVLPYYGYGAGVVRLHWGDNWESGGKNRASVSEWIFLTGATLEVDGRVLIRDGVLLEQ
jgi:dipeptidyl aminopeptidase/acylaminoacyl peptidase/leucyl aminopeptidase (aminopeptidase T)